ncbi:type I-D CRISPR-associated protein Cas10d/Csc3 [Kroppenstedtia eburnea]|uniref:type I-D CRISPR-associated protein Cas10d/Csc3 n=1 Tax=Kroppenstedtia eburnea TaxID=714067 RepID=UPI003631E7CC
MREHIRSGIQAFLSLVQYLEEFELEFDEKEMKMVMVAYILHDLHKEEAARKDGSSEYDVSLRDIEEIGEKLCEGLPIQIPPAAFLRVAGVSSFSNKLGDLSFLPDDFPWSYLRDWVKLMDQAASITGIAECREKRTVPNLKQLLGQLLPPKLAESLTIEFHCLQEVRGVITTQLHNGMSLFMKRNRFFPWLRFGDGTLYLSLQPDRLPEKNLLIEDLVQLFFLSVGESADQLDPEKLFDRSTFRCQTLSFMLYSEPEDFSRLFHQLFLKDSQKDKHFPDVMFDDKRNAKYGMDDLKGLYEFMGIDLPLTEDLRKKWFYTARYFAALQRLIQRLEEAKGAEAIRSLAKYLKLDANDILKKVPSELQSNSRRFDEAIWLSYRYLRSAGIDGKSVTQVPVEEWRLNVKEMATNFLSGRVTLTRSLEIVNREMKIQDELRLYFQEQLTVSWERSRELHLLNQKELTKKKTRSQKKICNLCNRQIPPRVEQKVKAPIIQDDVQVFSNRLLPKENSVSALHWCSICSFEYILRQILGLDSPGEKGISHRLYLFAFPAHQFTDLVLAEMEEELKGLFGSIHVHYRGRIRGAWQEPYIQGEEERFRDHLREHLRRYSDYFQMELAERGRLPSTGDLLKTGPPGNVMMFTFDCYSHTVERTREEAWMKALTAAVSLHKLYGFRIMVTEKPYLFLSDIRDVHYAVHLDSPPYKVSRLLGSPAERGTPEFVIPIEQVTEMLYQLAWLWEMHQAVHPLDFAKPTDKNISSILHQLEVHPMPGAYYFKRLLTNQTHPAASVVQSCRELNQIKGGYEMGLSKEISEASLALFEPYNQVKGRAHRYENLFRTVVEGIKEGRDRSELEGKVMKRLERLVSQRVGRVHLPIDVDAVKRLVTLVYEDFFMKRCGGSLAKLNQKQNQVADGVFFETHLVVQEERISKKEQLSSEETSNLGG